MADRVGGDKASILSLTDEVTRWETTCLLQETLHDLGSASSAVFFNTSLEGLNGVNTSTDIE